ncbi:uncharacterized protein BXZ73DRAFT_82442 [Epithele typhae]|uniref:uncharacterized protein n=1 Tax=Epithele typhae TaxID=378194 RepID=UPI0020084C50|nr:uncharacterized protein BXZ73DRAFT_82442 [Epithele typhae]KAH9912145.1 hypothetical protein BXZ73DRAFT_82442 [Epithele typhae]
MSSTPTLLIELLHAVFKEAWTSCALNSERKSLYLAFQASSVSLAKIAATAAVCYPYLCTTLTTTHALDSGLLALASNNIAAIDKILANSPSHTDQPLITARHIRIDVATLMHFSGMASDLYISRWDASWDAFIRQHARVIHACPSLTLCGINSPLHYNLLSHIIRTLAAALSSLTHLRLDIPYRSNVRLSYGQANLRGVSLPNLAFLRIHMPFPCICASTHPATVHEREGCFPTELWAALPNLEHIQIDVPGMLKDLDLPWTVHRSTLAAAPVHLPGREPASTIVGYNLVSTLRQRMLREPTTEGVKRVLTVEIVSDTEEVFGYDAAAAASARFGFKIKKIVHR